MPGLPHKLLGEPLLTSTSLNSGPDAHALALLASIDRAAQDLPSIIPEAEEDEDMARVVLAGEPEDPSEAWEYLDPVLNRLLGYGVDVEEIAQRVRRGPLGVEGLTRYIRGFVVTYGVPGALLEGKLERLSDAIELVIQSVLVRLSNRRFAYQNHKAPWKAFSCFSVTYSFALVLAHGPA
jgi:hypothetical protein